MVQKRLSKHTSAIGLSYQRNADSSPKVSVKGEHFEADEVVRLAKRFGIPIIKKKELAQALKSLNLDDNVPVELFEAVALVIAQVEKEIK